MNKQKPQLYKLRFFVTFPIRFGSQTGKSKKLLTINVLSTQTLTVPRFPSFLFSFSLLPLSARIKRDFGGGSRWCFSLGFLSCGSLVFLFAFWWCFSVIFKGFSVVFLGSFQLFPAVVLLGSILTYFFDFRSLFFAFLCSGHRVGCKHFFCFFRCNAPLMFGVFFHCFAVFFLFRRRRNRGGFFCSGFRN